MREDPPLPKRRDSWRKVMTATAQLSSDPPATTEELQHTVRDLESKASELREIQNAPDRYRAEETRDLELRKRALQDEIAQLEAHPPRLFMGKHKMRLEDLRIDLRYLDTQLVKIENDRAHYLSWLPTEIQRTANELELARRELGRHGVEIREPEPRRSEIHSFQAPEPRTEEVRETQEPQETQEPLEADDTFYRETMAPAILALMEARMDENRLRFIDGYREATTLLGRRQLAGLDDAEQEKCRILYDFVLGYPCVEWFPGDPALLLADLRDRARAWNSSVDSD